MEIKKLKSLRLLVAIKLEQIGCHCFKESMIEKFIGDKLETIGEYAFSQSYFLKEINLKNVK